MKYKKAVQAHLVYQGGIANVFMQFGGKDIIRVLQEDFKSCEMFCRGVKIMGAEVLVWHCDEAGDVAGDVHSWLRGSGDLFLDSKHSYTLR
jgi:hypothetical protein